MFDPSKIGQRQNASARVVAWAKDLLPDTVEACAQNHDDEHAIDAAPARPLDLTGRFAHR